jgi:pRiA4b ORF-3-like protein
MAGVTDKPDSPEDLLRRLFAYAGDSFEERLRQKLAAETYLGGRRIAKQSLPKLPKRAETTVHVVKVNLHGAKTPVWRRLEIPSAMTLDLAHQVLQAAFDWSGYHLHCFETVCGEYGDPSRDDDWSERGESCDESAATLAQVATAQKAKVVYVYDFGDDWRHDIVVEKIQPAAPGVSYPRCTGGRGETPAEDSGGIWAFNEERGQEGVPGGRFDPAGVTLTLAALADVITPAT